MIMSDRAGIVPSPALLMLFAAALERPEGHFYPDPMCSTMAGTQGTPTLLG